MTSFVRRPSMFLLLVVCGPALHSAFAAPGPSCKLLDRLSISNGKYIYEADGKQVESTTRPVDIPALNQYYPFYGVQLEDGELMYDGISLLVPLDDTSLTLEYYPFKNMSMYGASDSDFSTITRDDLKAEPSCTANSSISGGVVSGRMHCFDFGYDSIIAMSSTCTSRSVSSAPGLPSPEAFESLPPPVYHTRIVQYPLPEAWLEGEVCESSCCA